MSFKRRLLCFLLIVLVFLQALFARDKFALVLSGGGARGIAHIPVLKELEKRGIVPDLIVGTSMGALIGGFYAAGWSADEIEELVLTSDILDKMMIINNRIGEASFLAPNSLSDDNILAIQFGSDGIGSSNGILDDQKINGFLRENLVNVLDVDDFDDLSIPFRAIGADITTGNEIIFDSGSLFTALRASMSLPIIFPPVKIGEDTYVMDGGILNNLPVDVAESLGADIILAVDVNDALNTNKSVTASEMETLTGAISAFSRSLNMTNSVPQYERADWVLVPEVNEFDTIAFDESAAILEAGRKCVYENINVFDKIERAVGKREHKNYISYSDREPSLIESIEKNGIDGFDKALNAFIGKPFDKENAEKLESLLADIKYHNRLKNLSYDFNDGVINLQPSFYNAMDGIFTLGTTGVLGIEYNGVDKPFFMVSPSISAAAQYHISPKAIVSAGLIFHDTLTLEAILSVPIYNNAYYYAGLNFDYLNLSRYSLPTIKGRVMRNDLGGGLNTGLFWDLSSGLLANFSLGFDYVHLTSFYLPDEKEPLFPYRNYSYIYGLVSLGYDSLDRKNALSKGARVDISFDIGGELDFDNTSEFALGYSFRSKSEFVFGGIDSNFRGICDIEIDTIRRRSDLGDAYATTKTGIATPDYLYGLIGVRGGIPNIPLYFDIAPFVEYFKPHCNNPSWDNYVPFSTLADWTLGAKLGFGISTSIGTVFMDFFFGASDTFRCSVLLGLK